ncbi:uncharacterized protein LOC128243531 isoform X2 [Mya arenaria]|nr:uncharacterized protein LOC128243531 isoform X2 [Mya arenaria]
MNLVEVFMLQNWDKANLNANDLSVALTVWQKCLVFPATLRPLAKTLRKSRKKIAHTTSLDENHKQTVFNDIKQVIQHADVVNYLHNPVEIQNSITDLENGDLFEFENELREIMNNTNEAKERPRTILWILIAVCIAILAIALMFMQQGLPMIFTIPQFKPSMEKTGCLQEYSPLFPTSPLLVDFFKHHKPLVVRVWMFQLLDEHLKNTKKNGILFEADMGYGKSAIAAHITCAKEGDQGIDMRKRLIAFHVCKFDVKKTHQTGVFIQRLVSMISNNIPEFSQIINEKCLQSFKTGQCDSDPFGCIDECIIFPLIRTKISDGSEEYRLIIIDALDECYDTFSFEKSNKIFNLMERRAKMLPSWIKLLITSRRLPRNERLEYNLDRIYFHTLDSRNLNDIDLFFNQSSREKNVTFFQLAVNADLTQPNLIGNLNRYYRDQFDRWYDHGFDFSKSILEVVVTTYLKKTPENIREVISLNAVENVSLSMFENELSIIRQFTDIIDGEIEFKHFSLFKWLEEECPDEKYCLSLSNGHQANAHFILHELNTSNITFDVTNLLLHIQSANDGSGLQEQFMNIPKEAISRIEKKFSEAPVVRIIKRGKMKEIPEILFHHFPGGNHFSTENISAAFIAAENGYTYALKQLVDHGADIHFRIPTFSNMLTMHDAVEIAFKFKHWNYGLLDIAAQHGHTETVRLILHDGLFSSYKLHERNGINLSPWHLACMFNRSEVVEVFLRFNRSFVDWKCLYFAAEKGNVKIVKLLLDAGIYDECVLCTNELYWIPNGTARVQADVHQEMISMYVLFDDWSELSCESALHAAIRQNHINIVRELLKDSKHSTLHCLDRGGRPPLISALQSNRTEMVGLFLEVSNAHIIKVQCQKVPLLKDNLQINRIELVKLNHMKCRAGHGTEHAIPPMSEVLQNIIDHTNLDFNRRDEDECLPIHYAACGNNVEYLRLLLQHHEMLFQNLLCSNNTNALHSTIHCKAFDTFTYFINSYDKLKSRSGFGQEMEEYVLYLLRLSNDKGEYAKDAIDKTWKNMFILMIEKFHVDISIMSDEKGKSMLHYIVKNGHFELLDYLVAKKHNLVLELLQRVSLKGESQIQYLAKYMPKRKYVRTELVFESSLTHPVEHDQKKLSAREYCFSLASSFLTRHGVFKTEEKIAILKHLLRKQSYNLADIYLKNIMSTDQLFKSNVFRIILHFDNNGHITKNYLLLLLHDIETQHRPDFKRYDILMCSTCQELRKKCLVHMFTRKISLFEENLISIFGYAYEKIYFRVFELMIKLIDEVTLSSCVDQQGLNLLELAINSKSAMLMKFFMDKGVKIKFPLRNFYSAPLWRKKVRHYI